MRLYIENMTCGGCVRSVTKAIQSVDPAATIDADVDRRRVDVDTHATQDAITAAVTAAGFTVGSQ